MSRNTFKRHVDLLLIREEDKRHYVLIKDISTFMHDHTVYFGRKHFSCDCLQTFRTNRILKCHINNCFKIISKQRIKMPKKG